MNPRDLICFRCKHWEDFSLGCKAFPEGIPEEVIETNEHNKPLKGQNNSLVFTPAEPTNKKGE